MIDIVIVNWNAGEQLRTCINSISQHGAGLVGQIVVVDNGSADGSDASVESLPNVTLIRAGANLGFGKACNLGARQAKSEYLLFLNPDAALYPDTLCTVLAYMQDPGSAKVGICGVQLLDENGHITTAAARFPTLRVMAGKILGLTTLLPSMFPAHLMSSSDLSESGVVDQVMGAFFLIRKNIFDQCHGFDERFFVYFEEVDLCLRIKQLGYTSYFLKNASAFHKGGGCSDQVKAARLFYSLRSRILYAQKHYSWIELTALILLTGLELPLRLTQAVLRASLSDIRNVLSAYRRLIFYFVWKVQ